MQERTMRARLNWVMARAQVESQCCWTYRWQADLRKHPDWWSAVRVLWRRLVSAAMADCRCASEDSPIRRRGPRPLRKERRGPYETWVRRHRRAGNRDSVEDDPRTRPD